MDRPRKMRVPERMQNLITFLGRGQHDPSTGYRRSQYRFPAGTLREGPFFGMQLAQELQPGRLVILGTAGSMWSTLVEYLARDRDPTLEDERLALLDAEMKQAVTRERLAPLRELVSESTRMEVDLRLIPSARDLNEQLQILQDIADAIPRGRVNMDLTHGFRHLGMLGFLSAYFLEAIRNSVRVDTLWYAALDMTPREGPEQGQTPVLQLDGLDAVHRWIDALSRFDASGDYGVFAALLEQDGLAPDKARCLVEAYFYETTLNVSAARQQLQTFLRALKATPMNGASPLFQDKLNERLSWAWSTDLADNQRTLASRALNRKDYPRAAIFGFEAFLTRLCREQGEPPTDTGARERVREAFSDTVDQEPQWKRDAWHVLRQLRNAMAHGTPPRHPRVIEIIRNRERLGHELEAAINRLTNT